MVQRRSRGRFGRQRSILARQTAMPDADLPEKAADWQEKASRRWRGLYDGQAPDNEGTQSIMNRIAIITVIIAAAIASNKASAAQLDTKSAVALCLGEVHRQHDPSGIGWFRDFDAYFDPATNGIHSLGAKQPTFLFEKCMASKGHSVQLNPEN
jgi:hypothetical protein